jgi:GH35 family endo-1,4-beta-xylanase
MSVLHSNHVEWLNHPMTRLVFSKILDKQIETVSDKIADSSMSTDVSNETVRHFAVQLKTLKTIRKVMYDTETFIARTQ